MKRWVRFWLAISLVVALVAAVGYELFLHGEDPNYFKKEGLFLTYPGERPGSGQALPVGTVGELDLAYFGQGASKGTVSPQDELRGVWLSYIELGPALKGKSEADAAAAIGEMFDQVKGLGLNTVVVQVRPFGDALYPSKVFPWSHILTGTQGTDPGYDPLAVMIKAAHDRGLAIHGWVNPFRVATGSATLSPENPAVKWAKDPETADYVKTLSNGTYYNPGYQAVRDLIVSGVKELVDGYDLDGIHMDDYFYPTTADEFDALAYQKAKEAGSTLERDAWRLENVNLLVKALYDTVHQGGKGILFGISPQGNVDNNYKSQFADVRTWCSQSGYIDYICPQIYYGYQNQTQPFDKVAEQWSALVTSPDVQLIFGVTLHKLGKEDTYAGTGKDEWLSTDGIVAKQLATSKGTKGYHGFILYSYKFIFSPEAERKAQVENEVAKLREYLATN